MIASKTELLSVLRQFNPWWVGGQFPELPPRRRAAFRAIVDWVSAPPASRALLLSGARQVGKTTLFLQTIDDLIRSGVAPANILYVTFDHPLLKLSGPADLLSLWREFEPSKEGPEYLFLDEIQMVKDWQVWLKHQVDFEKHRRIAVTGSATPLAMEGQESGVGRWHTIRLATMSFFEYLQIRGVAHPVLPELPTLRSLFQWPEAEFARVAATAGPLVSLFHEYLLRGGFPQGALVENIQTAQKLLREDIVDKALKRDMTALFGVRRILELEQVFLYLCLHDGGQLSMPDLCKQLELKRPTVGNFISLLEAANLIYRLLPFGYGKQVVRGRPKIYLADPAIAPSVLLKGKSLLEDSEALGRAVETAFFKHVFARYYAQSVSFSYWRGKRDREVDIIAQLPARLVPFEVKYRASTDTRPPQLKGLAEFCAERRVAQAYVITRDLTDFGVTSLGAGQTAIAVLRVPAPLACYWLGRSELTPTRESEAESG